MRLSGFSGLLVPLTAVATLACGDDDLVLPTDETPSSRRPAALEIYSGNGLVGTSGMALDEPVIVQVVDQEGAGLAGQTVSWRVATGDGSITPTSVTNSEGLAAATWTLGNPGPNTLTATVAGVGSVTFIATANNNGNGGGGSTASRVEVVEGNYQSAETGSPVPVSPSVLVTNSAGEPVAGVTVTFVVTQGGGSVSGAAQTTDAQGIARVGSWTLGAEGLNTLEAHAGSLAGSPVVFQATATAPPGPPPAEPHHFEFRVQPHDVREDEWFTVEVAIMDASGNVVPLDGTEIYLGLWETGDDHPTNGRLAGDRFEDTIDGVATFRLYVSEEGSYRLNARSDYLPKHLGPYGPELFSNTFEVD